MNRRTAITALALAAALALSGCETEQAEHVAAPAAPPAVVAEGTALDVLASLEVKGKAPMTGYDREGDFPHWLDLDGDGCDADDQAVKLHANVELADNCREVAATMVDPYSGQQISWGAKRTSVVDIDHVVSLGNAWSTGAQYLDPQTRAAIANDQLNLLPVDASLNRQKQDADAATWLPPAKGFRCEYVARQVGVKARYGLWVTQAEKDAIARVLDTCPDQVVPDAGAPAHVAAAPEPEPAPAPAAATEGNDPRFGTCKEAIAAGYGPYAATDAEYSWYRDGDSDGTVCER